jgi:D-3-phosphoglycerate dehydrogenase / 2-oxoglutarate reductase
MKVLITCPPMLGLINEFRSIFSEKEIEIHCPNVIQTLSEEELKSLVPQYDGWIIGDDPATAEVLEAGVNGNLKAAVKWGVGIDNVNFTAAKELNLPIANTPKMFGKEVADITVGYVIALARQTFYIHQGVLNGAWLKPSGISLAGKTVALVGFGDIGRNTAKRLIAADMHVIAYDPYFQQTDDFQVESATWPDALESADFVILTCALTPENKHMVNFETISKMKKGVRIVNVARGPLIQEEALIQGLKDGKVHSAALDVFEVEPLELTSPLRQFDSCIFGSHNSSNTIDAVRRASLESISILFNFLNVK